MLTADKNGSPGHPTKRFDLIRKLRKKGEVRIVGGAASGKPPVAVFLKREFDPAKMTERKFLVVLDPGYCYIGFVVCEVKNGKLIVYGKGTLETRISGIKLLMTERRAYRRFRRHLSRGRKKRLSVKEGRALTKFKKPRNVRSREKSSATLDHAVATHLNLFHKLLKLFSLPASQTQFVMEDNVFDVRAMTWGKTYGNGYQASPRQPKQKKCFVCDTTDDLNEHHLVRRKKGGTEIQENKIWLCVSCHGEVHAGRIYLPVRGIKQWRELGTMNAVMGVLRKTPWINFVSVSDAIAERRRLGLEKTHEDDALAAAAAFSGAIEIAKTGGYRMELVKFRRHSRARTHALRDRLYKINGKIIARNRRKRSDQKEKSFAEVNIHTLDQKNLRVYPGIRLLKPLRNNVAAIGGDVFLHEKHRFVATGVASGRYIYSPEIKKVIGKPYVHPDACRRVIRNEGVVCVRLSSPT